MSKTNVAKSQEKIGNKEKLELGTRVLFVRAKTFSLNEELVPFPPVIVVLEHRFQFFTKLNR